MFRFPHHRILNSHVSDADGGCTDRTFYPGSLERELATCDIARVEQAGGAGEQLFDGLPYSLRRPTLDSVLLAWRERTYVHRGCSYQWVNPEPLEAAVLRSFALYNGQMVRIHLSLVRRRRA